LKRLIEDPEPADPEPRRFFGGAPAGHTAAVPFDPRAGRDARPSSGAARLRDQQDRPNAREGTACSRHIFLPSMFLPSVLAALLDDQ
jgi:hypothetical protein